MDCFQRVDKNKKLTDEQKGRIVSLRIEGHHNLETIAQMTGTSVKTVQKWINRYEQEGSVHRKFGAGRPRITTQEQDREIIDYLKENPFSTAVRAAALENVPYRTALRRIHENNLGNFIAAHHTRLTEQHKRDRIAHCHYMLDVIKEENFKDIIFTDEKIFRSDESRCVRVYRPKGQRYFPEFVCEDNLSGKISAGYWGWISCAGPGELVETGAHFNSDKYLEILDEVALPSIVAQFGSIDNILFMQDNSRIHTARKVQDYLVEKHVRVLNHPPFSPDFNLIENIWSVLEHDRPQLIERTHEGLNEHVFSRWENLRNRQDIFNNLYNSLAKRFRYVLNHGGNIYHNY